MTASWQIPRQVRIRQAQAGEPGLAGAGQRQPGRGAVTDTATQGGLESKARHIVEHAALGRAAVAKSTIERSPYAAVRQQEGLATDGRSRRHLAVPIPPHMRKRCDRENDIRVIGADDLPDGEADRRNSIVRGSPSPC
eukprot:scaffold1517_cov397-Prasinococcus_capsulatus_cf.AAC.12